MEIDFEKRDRKERVIHIFWGFFLGGVFVWVHVQLEARGQAGCLL